MTTTHLRVVRESDLDFATRAAVYLDKQGLGEEAIISCLMEEFELDRDTAEAVASLAA